MMSETSLRHCLYGSLRPVLEEVQTIASETSLKKKEIRCVRLVSEESEKRYLRQVSEVRETGVLRLVLERY